MDEDCFCNFVVLFCESICFIEDLFELALPVVYSCLGAESVKGSFQVM